jgi:hypothetical protein
MASVVERRSVIRFLEALVVLVLLAGSARADDAHLLRLGEHFYTAGQYYRAVGTFEELALFTSDARTRVHAQLRVGQSYHHGAQVDEAVAAYDVVLGALGTGADAADLRGYVHLLRVLVRADGVWRGVVALPLGDLAAEIEPLSHDEGRAYQVLAGFHLARLRLADGDRAGARAAYEAAQARCKARPVDDCAAVARLAGPLDAPGPRRKIPALGIALSAVVPGLGSFYTGSYFDAAYYFGLTVGSGLLAADVYDRDARFGQQNAAFYVLSALAVTFYAASVTQGWLGAVRYNEVQKYEHRRHVLEDTDVPLPLEGGLPDVVPPPAPAPADPAVTENETQRTF